MALEDVYSIKVWNFLEGAGRVLVTKVLVCFSCIPGAISLGH